MTAAETELLHIIVARFKGKTGMYSPKQFLRAVKAKDALVTIQSTHFRYVLLGMGIALFYSHFDPYIRVVDLTVKKLPRYVWGAHTCQFCNLYEEVELDLVPELDDNGEWVEGQNVHSLCRKPLRLLREELRLVKLQKLKAELL
ncbi:hypothetical protein NVV94_12140 [Pseudomonas sp. LS1212]|uniref:hypothetical protein n=1 Tax=Pseudomonas sp. LS1212 TaxID=2972478 RepID=UPI00215CC098|nr:hypothetical protein [Pseudomonas sp. LS1212]UVJ46214.1 hypothetical protein NVV94_12140 [Pseudomonas sp. LS1212]